MRAKVWQVGKTWHYAVYDSDGRIWFCDNTNDWWLMYTDALADLYVAHRIVNAGHTMKRGYDWGTIDLTS
jgi:hypothetical protein